MTNFKRKTYQIVLILTIASIISCNKKFANYDLEFEGSKLVANGLLTENGVSVSLTKSLNPVKLNKSEDILVNNGRVWLYRNDSLLVELNKSGKEKFETKNITPQVGVYYKIKAVAQGFDTLVSNNITLPSLPNIKSYTLIKNDSLAINSGYGATLFSAQLVDDISIKNSYMIDSYVQLRSDSINSNYLKGIIYNGNTSNACEFDSYANIPFFTDKCFNGGEYKVNYTSEHQRKGIFFLNFSAIDNNFLLYLRSLDQPIGIELNFAEPKIQYSNIKNGYGVFVAKNTLSFSLKLN